MRTASSTNKIRINPPAIGTAMTAALNQRSFWDLELSSVRFEKMPESPENKQRHHR